MIYFWEGVGRISGMCELLKVLEVVYVYIKNIIAACLYACLFISAMLGRAQRKGRGEIFCK